MEAHVGSGGGIHQVLWMHTLGQAEAYIKLGGDDLPWKDFGEIYEAKGKEGIIMALKSAKKYSEIEI